MKIFAAVFALLLSGIAFAQQIDDIGRTLFVELLGMRNYPGAPFTGNVINDLIMFLIIPTIFIIFVVFILLGRLAVTQKGIRLMLGVGIYLFIIAGGYYNTFALAAGPYFIFLIFILGLLYFIPSHFRVRGGGMPGGAGATLEGTESSLAKQLVLKQIMVKEQEAGLKRARTANDPRTADYESRVAELKAEIKVLEGEIRLNPAERIAYSALRHKYHV